MQKSTSPDGTSFTAGRLNDKRMLWVNIDDISYVVGIDSKMSPGLGPISVAYHNQQRSGESSRIAKMSFRHAAAPLLALARFNAHILFLLLSGLIAVRHLSAAVADTSKRQSRESLLHHQGRWLSLYQTAKGRGFASKRLLQGPRTRHRGVGQHRHEHCQTNLQYSARPAAPRGGFWPQG